MSTDTAELKQEIRAVLVDDSVLQERKNNAQIDDLGGIDMNSTNLDLQIKRDGRGVPLPLSQQNLDNIHINGLVPVILDITPAATLPLFSELTATSSHSTT